MDRGKNDRAGNRKDATSTTRSCDISRNFENDFGERPRICCTWTTIPTLQCPFSRFAENFFSPPPRKQPDAGTRSQNMTSSPFDERGSFMLKLCFIVQHHETSPLCTWNNATCRSGPLFLSITCSVCYNGCGKLSTLWRKIIWRSWASKGRFSCEPSSWTSKTTVFADDSTDLPRRRARPFPPLAAGTSCMRVPLPHVFLAARRLATNLLGTQSGTRASHRDADTKTCGNFCRATCMSDEERLTKFKADNGDTDLRVRLAVESPSGSPHSSRSCATRGWEGSLITPNGSANGTSNKTASKSVSAAPPAVSVPADAVFSTNNGREFLVVFASWAPFVNCRARCVWCRAFRCCKQDRRSMME